MVLRLAVDLHIDTATGAVTVTAAAWDVKERRGPFDKMLADQVLAAVQQMPVRADTGLPVSAVSRRQIPAGTNAVAVTQSPSEQALADQIAALGVPLEQAKIMTKLWPASKLRKAVLWVSNLKKTQDVHDAGALLERLLNKDA